MFKHYPLHLWAQWRHDGRYIRAHFKVNTMRIQNPFFVRLCVPSIFGRIVRNHFQCFKFLSRKMQLFLFTPATLLAALTFVAWCDMELFQQQTKKYTQSLWISACVQSMLSCGMGEWVQVHLWQSNGISIFFYHLYISHICTTYCSFN